MISRTPPKIKRQTHLKFPPDPGLSPKQRSKITEELLIKQYDKDIEKVKKQMEEVRSKLGQTNPKEFLQTTTPIRSRPKLRRKGKNILDSSNISSSKKMTDPIVTLVEELKTQDEF